MVHHPLFSQAYIWGQDILEKMVGSVRSVQNQRAYGATLIVGAGTGLDIPQLGPRVSEIVLLEPDATMREYLREQYPHLEIVSSLAECMEIEDQRFDTVVSSLVLCTVARVDETLREIYRVLKPGGQYLFMEHVQHPDRVSQTLQNLANPLWQRIGGGCQLNRDIAQNLGRSPLTVDEYAIVKPNFLIPIVAGHAVKTP